MQSSPSGAAPPPSSAAPPEQGAADWLLQHAGFDPAFYLACHPDVVPYADGPAVHYLRHGAWEGRWPRPDFDPAFYLAMYPDVRLSGIEPLTHFARSGLAEGRLGQAPPCEPGVAMVPVWAMEMDGDIRPTGAPFGFEATGRDPQLRADVSLPAGFFRLQLRLLFAPLSRALRTTGFCQIFIGDRNGIIEANSYSFRLTDGVFVLNELLFNPHPVHQLRLDPANGRAEFVVQWLAVGTVPFPPASQQVLRRVVALDPAERGPLLAALHEQDHDTWWRAAAQAALHTPTLAGGTYERYQAARRIDAKARAYLHARAAAWPEQPLLSVLMPVYKPGIPLLEEAIASLRDQTYAAWELLIVDDGSNQPALSAYLAAQSADPRIRIRTEAANRGIAAATNLALDMAQGVFVVLLDQDDRLAPQALHAVARAIVEQPDVDMIYSDEDKIAPDGSRFGAFFKPDWSPEFFLSCMYTCHLGAYRTGLVRQVGGFRPESDFAQDYDMALRLTEQARRITHIPDVLYHWRIVPGSTAGGAEGKPIAEQRARQAVQDALDRRGLPGEALPAPLPGMHRVRIAPSGRRISLVILTAARRTGPAREEWLVLDLVRSIAERTAYPDYELVIVHNGDMEPALAEGLAPFRPTLVHYAATPFNLPDKMNLGVQQASGELVVLLNDDMLVQTPDWLAEMAQWFEVPGIAGVGAKLLFPDGKVQHAGVLLLGQGPSHPWYGAGADDPGLMGGLLVARNYSAVTGACLMVRRQDYIEVGGFDPSFCINYNDVDFCLRLLARGRIVLTPYARLTHYEAVSKEQTSDEELIRFNARWGDVLGNDPAYNRNLSQTSAWAELAPIPRTIYDDY